MLVVVDLEVLVVVTEDDDLVVEDTVVVVAGVVELVRVPVGVTYVSQR